MHSDGECRDRPRIRVANSVHGIALRDRLDRLVRGLPWAELCAVRVPAIDLSFVDAGEAVWPAGSAAVVAVLKRPDPALLDAAVRTGARGLLLADDPTEDFRRSIRDVLCRGGWISPRLARQLLARLPAIAPAPDPTKLLTPLTVRERQALRLLVEGRVNAEIAATMYVSVSAVKYHVSNILRKFGCRDRTQLVAHLNRAGLHAGHL